MRPAPILLAVLLLVSSNDAASAGSLTISAPTDWQVVQRSSEKTGEVAIYGTFEGEAPAAGAVREVQARLGGGTGEPWRRIVAEFDGKAFRGLLRSAAGGWRNLEVRVVELAGGQERTLATAAVEHVGVGEVFVVAGQSNSANYGEEKQRPKSGMVSTFDGKSWRPADDPQPGAGGQGGSFLPPLGDLLAARYKVPIGFASCGVGGSSVREWLPQGDSFPNPPTVESHVRKRGDARWESKGEIFARFVARMKSLGPNGFRAVLWHQGESDANQKDSSRTLPGKLYREYLERVVTASRDEIGWEAPWFVARASYHAPDDPGSDDVRAAQKAMTEVKRVFAGPDSDALSGKHRDGGGRGVHFSGPGLRAHAAAWFDRVAPWLDPQLAGAAAPPGEASDDALGPDPFASLEKSPPEILRELPLEGPHPAGVTLRRVVFRSRNDSEIFAVIAAPAAPPAEAAAAGKTKEKLPGILVLHGGGGSAEVEKAIHWAQRGYVAVAPDLPGIGEPKKLVHSKGAWSALKYGAGRYVAEPDANASVLVDAVLSAMKALELLRSQPQVDSKRIGVVGISWGGYMTTMVCGLAGDRVKAGFSVYGCGFYELTSQKAALDKLPPAERARWLRWLDSGRRAKDVRAAYFVAAAADDFFFWPPAVQATLDAIPHEVEKNLVFAPNANHKIPLPGGTIFAKSPEQEKPFLPTPFQPFPTPSGSKANWLAMEVPYFDHHLRGGPVPFARVALPEKNGDENPLLARFRATGPRPTAKAEVWYSLAGASWDKRTWYPLPATPKGDGWYEATLPEAAEGGHWFAVVSDDLPSSVSSGLVWIPSTKAPQQKP